jgi:hypothetical protein
MDEDHWVGGHGLIRGAPVASAGSDVAVSGWMSVTDSRSTATPRSTRVPARTKGHQPRSLDGTPAPCPAWIMLGRHDDAGGLGPEAFGPLRRMTCGREGRLDRVGRARVDPERGRDRRTPAVPAHRWLPSSYSPTNPLYPAQTPSLAKDVPEESCRTTFRTCAGNHTSPPAVKTP